MSSASAAKRSVRPKKTAANIRPRAHWSADAVIIVKRNGNGGGSADATKTTQPVFPSTFAFSFPKRLRPTRRSTPPAPTRPPAPHEEVKAPPPPPRPRRARHRVDDPHPARRFAPAVDEREE